MPDTTQTPSAEELLDDSFFARKASGKGESRIKVYYGSGQNNGYVSARAIEKYNLSKWGRIYITHQNRRGRGRNRFRVGDDGFVIIFSDNAETSFGAKLNKDGKTFQFYGNGMVNDLNLDLPVEFELTGVESKGKSCSLYAKLIRQGMREN